VNSNGLYKYTFELQIQQSSTGIEIREIKAYDSGNNQITITNITSHATFSGSLGPENAYDGNMSPLYTMHNSDNTWSTGSKLFTVTTNSLVYKFGIVGERPQYRPGYNIKYNDASIFTDTSNGGSASNPQGVETDYILGSHGTESETTKYTKGTTTYDVGKASIITVPDPGTYDAQLSQGSVFSLKSAAVPATKATGLYTWAFHHGNFDNAYGDGDILTARDNGRFYADTPAYTGDIGTISVELVVSSTQNFATTITPSGTGDWVGLYTWGLDTSQNTLTARFYELSTGSIKDGFEIRFENDSTVLYCDSSNNEWDPGWVSTSSSTTPAKSKTLILGETVDLYRNYNPASTKVGSFTVTSGHLFSLATSNKLHTTYTFAPPSGGLTANVLMVAGGGGGGRSYGWWWRCRWSRVYGGDEFGKWRDENDRRRERWTRLGSFY